MKLPKPTALNIALGVAAAWGLLYVAAWWSLSPKATGGGGLFQPPAFDPTSNL